MSGIAGIYSFNNSIVQEKQLETLLSKISHRGLEGCRLWRSGHVGFVHCLSVTTPEDAGKLYPYQDTLTQIVITADARIDNRNDLIEKIGISDNPYSLSDSKLIVEAYKKWGTNCPVELIGDFSFAIWDPTQNHLFCARDHIGTRPFFYTISDKYIAFSSDIRSLTILPEISSTIDDTKMADFLNLRVENNSDTFFKNIKRLSPATSMVFTSSKKRFVTYWDVADIEPCHKKNNDEYAEEFKSVFFEAVQCRLRSSSRIGYNFSGGLDSSAVLSSAKVLRQYSRKLQAFSFNFNWLPDGHLDKIDELKYQLAMVNEGNVEHNCINGNQHKPFGDLPSHLNYHGEPFFFPHLYLNGEIWKLAGEKNIRVMLDGLDGDSVISHGYEHLQHLALGLNIPELFRQLKYLSLEQKIPLKNSSYSYIIYPYMRAPLASLYKRIKGEFYPLTNVNDIISKDFAVATKLPQRSVPELLSFYSARKMHYKKLVNPLLTTALEMTNNFSAQLGIENRSPFFDRRLMEFCFSLPSDQKLQNGRSRFVLREAMKNIMPEKIRTRVGKSNLTPGFIYNLLQNHQELINEIINKPHSELHSKINLSVLQKQWQVLKEHPFSCPRRYHLNIYNVVIVNSWLDSCHKC